VLCPARIVLFCAVGHGEAAHICDVLFLHVCGCLLASFFLDSCLFVCQACQLFFFLCALSSRVLGSNLIAVGTPHMSHFKIRPQPSLLGNKSSCATFSGPKCCISRELFLRFPLQLKTANLQPTTGKCFVCVHSKCDPTKD